MNGDGLQINDPWQSVVQQERQKKSKRYVGRTITNIYPEAKEDLIISIIIQNSHSNNEMISMKANC